MRRQLFLLLLAVVLPGWTSELAGQAATPAVLMSKGSTEIPVSFVPDTQGVWSGGVLLVARDRLSGAPTFRLFDRDGQQISDFSFAIPDVSRVNAYAFARGLDGSLAVSGPTYFNDGRSANSLALVSPDGQDQMLVRLSPFLPEAVTVAADGTIWVAGHKSRPFGEPRDYSQHLIRRYDRTGKMLGSFIPWSSLRTGLSTPDPDLTNSPDMMSILVSSADRVGWYSRHSRTYIEFSLDGAVISWIKTPDHQAMGEMLSVALCDDGGVFVAASILNGPNRTASWGIHALDRQRGEWSFIPRPEKWGMLYGCDGTRLASTTDFRTISWLEPTGK